MLDARLVFANYLESQSNIFTLLLGYLGMLATEALLPSSETDRNGFSASRIIALIISYGLLGFANYMLKSNFNIVGPLLVIAFYWYIRSSKKSASRGEAWPWAKRFLWTVVIFVLYLVPYFWVRSGFGDAAKWWEQVVNYAPWIAGHMIAGLIISLYNGKLGYHKKWFSRLYTVFYPVHIFIIGLICILTGRWETVPGRRRQKRPAEMIGRSFCFYPVSCISQRGLLQL